MAGMYAVYHGPRGPGGDRAARAPPRRRRSRAGCERSGSTVATRHFFDTLSSCAPARHRGASMRRALAAGFNLRHVDGATHRHLARRDHDRGRRRGAAGASFAGAASRAVVADRRCRGARPAARAARAHDRHFLTHPVFNRHHSETEMLRYLRALADKDLALDRTMIPLGSCTMKLNATTEMIPVTWPEFADLHPFAPADQAPGYRELVERARALARARSPATTRCSLQPNAGAQGEYAGLLAIRAYHASRGEGAPRRVPDPGLRARHQPGVGAHGRHARSSSSRLRRAGQRRPRRPAAKAAKHAADLAAIMVTYPSTHGVFERASARSATIVHAHGGQVYLDGANLNALVGLARPARFGADVSHLNLHKTFCIPHGGGGPGMGPIAVEAHLAPFLPGHPLRPPARRRRRARWRRRRSAAPPSCRSRGCTSR